MTTAGRHRNPRSIRRKAPIPDICICGPGARGTGGGTTPGGRGGTLTAVKNPTATIATIIAVHRPQTAMVPMIKRLRPALLGRHQAAKDLDLRSGGRAPVLTEQGLAQGWIGLAHGGSPSCSSRARLA